MDHQPNSSTIEEEYHSALTVADNEDASLSESQTMEFIDYVLGATPQLANNLLPEVAVVIKDLKVSAKTQLNSKIETVANKLFSFNKYGQNVILDNVSCLLNSGEMVLVLGKPGSGCTSLLKTICGLTTGFSSIEGEISYSGLSSQEFHHKYLAEATYNQEEDVHYASLTVEQTLKFCIKTIIKSTQQQQKLLEMVLKLFKLATCRSVVVGDFGTKGLSGGEKKRLSLAEQILLGSPINCWDGSTKGLDSSSAYEFVKTLKVLTTLLRKTTVVSIYQASEEIYKLFDKVLVLEKGQMVYFGPVHEAKQYFVDLGYACEPKGTSADFLTMLTEDSTLSDEKSIHADLISKYKASEIYKTEKKKIKEKEIEIKSKRLDSKFKQYCKNEKKYSKYDWVQKLKGPFYTVRWGAQFKACYQREIELFFGSKFALYSRFALIFGLAVVHGMLYYNLGSDSADAYTRAGGIYSAFLFNILLTISELPRFLAGRPITNKHRRYAVHSNSALLMAKVASDVPLLLLQTLPFCLIFYLMAGLQYSALKFLVFVVTVFISSICNTAMFRFIGAVSKSINMAFFIANSILVLFLLYNGFLIPYRDMRAWSKPIYYVDHLSYAIKALFANEYNGLSFICNYQSLIPFGPAYSDSNHQACVLEGSIPGTNIVEGLNYLQKAYGIEGSSYLVLKCLLIITGIWAIYLVLTLVFMNLAGVENCSSSNQKAYKQRSHKKPSKKSNQPALLARNEDCFWFNNINYTVKDGKENKKLLNNVKGVIEPGSLVALMGSSGAGKTTLLNHLSFRNRTGKREGEIYLGNVALDNLSAKDIGYCQQTDEHNETSTVREALKFSAYLRQPKTVPKSEKDLYVEKVLHLLDMQDVADALIGSIEQTGSGISLGARKKLTIGIELVALPKVLFLDEPTSGLDSIESLMIVNFLNKLKQQGQLIICTIHQPSSILFGVFDHLLLLGKGGHTVYFGSNSVEVLGDYFCTNGARKCREDENVAEYILNVTKHGNWPDVWKNSPQCKSIENNVAQRINNKVAENKEPINKVGLMVQTKLLLARMLVGYYRMPFYNLSRYVNQGYVALILGLSFYKLGNSYDELNNRVFAIFQVVGLGILLMINVQPIYYKQKMDYIRESKLGFYSWKAFVFSVVVVEIPFVITSSLLFCLLFLVLIGFDQNYVQVGWFCLGYILFELYSTSLGQAISAICSDISLTSLVNPSFTVSMSLFAGVAIQYKNIPVYLKYITYWINPYHYIIELMSITEIKDLVVQCKPAELVQFSSPANTTCSQYLGEYFNTVGKGYLINSTSQNCLYCPIQSGFQYLDTFSFDENNLTLDFYILILFYIFNILLICWFTYHYSKFGK